MTVEMGQATLPLDPQASLRTEMLGQIVAAHFALESAIAELTQAGGDPALIAETRMQMSGLAELRKQVAVSSGSALTSLRADINAASGASVSAALQARMAATNAASSMAADAIKCAEARQAIMSIGQDVFERKTLDPYLQFSSAEDEAAYRKRERENKEAYDKAIAQHTEDGDRRAAALLQAQLQDAKVHGADASPQFAAMEERTRQAVAALQMPEVRSDVAPGASKAATAVSPAKSTDGALDDVLAALKAAGVTTTDEVAGQTAHGLADNSCATRSQNVQPGRG